MQHSQWTRSPRMWEPSLEMLIELRRRSSVVPIESRPTCLRFKICRDRSSNPFGSALSPHGRPSTVQNALLHAILATLSWPFLESSREFLPLWYFQGNIVSWWTLWLSLFPLSRYFQVLPGIPKKTGCQLWGVIGGGFSLKMTPAHAALSVELKYTVEPRADPDAQKQLPQPHRRSGEMELSFQRFGRCFCRNTSDKLCGTLTPLYPRFRAGCSSCTRATLSENKSPHQLSTASQKIFRWGFLASEHSSFLGFFSNSFEELLT